MIQQIKVVVIGSVGVGKSSITSRYVNNDFTQNMQTTLGATYLEKVHDNHKIKFQFWDTAGQQKFRAIAKIYYKDAKVALIVYDRSNRNTFDSVKIWMEQLQQKGPQNITIAIVGNKIDLLTEQIPSIEAQQYAKKNNAIFMQTSAKDGRGINQLFNEIASKVENKKIVKRNNHKINKKKKNQQANCC